METYVDIMEGAALRIRIDGDWSCQDFSAFLESTNDAYRRVNSIFVLRHLIDREGETNRDLEDQKQLNYRDFTWFFQFHGSPHSLPDGLTSSKLVPYSDLIELTNAISGPLQVDAITYASPGWIQLVGNWNPLKVIADSVSKWRAENTKREANRLKAQTEQMRIQADLAAKILTQAPRMAGQYDAGTSRLVELAAEVIKPTTKYVERIRSDSRIVSAEVVSVGEPLPPSLS